MSGALESCPDEIGIGVRFHRNAHPGCDHESTVGQESEKRGCLRQHSGLPRCRNELEYGRDRENQDGAA
jgi:hypothetical protein